MGVSTLIGMKKYTKNNDFLKKTDGSKQAKNSTGAQIWPRIRQQHDFLRRMHLFRAQKLHGTTHSCKIFNFSRVFTCFWSGFGQFFSGICHSYTKPIQPTSWYHSSLQYRIVTHCSRATSERSPYYYGKPSSLKILPPLLTKPYFQNLSVVVRFWFRTK